MHGRPLSRRRFLSGAAAAGAASVLAPQTLLGEVASARRPRLFAGGRFPDGVLSGDPAPKGITLWTRVGGVGGTGSVRLEVARDPGFDRVVARESIRTGASLGHTVKARIGGLRPRERYYYRFETRGGQSTVGRFATAAPPDSDEPVRFAFFSCQDYPHGYYNAHELLAREDLDFVVDLGDYIYAETYYSKAKGTGVRDDRIGRVNPRNKSIVREAVTLEDYRDKYRLVRSDPALRRVHARFPMVSIWDDHEVLDNFAGGARGGGLPPEKRFSAGRRRAGVRAFFESMPLYASRGKDGRVYRALRFGRTLDLILLDERQYREDQPCGDSPGPACAELENPRTFLGAGQLAWAKRRLESSPAAWKIVANEVMIMPVKVGANAFANYDSWDGYPRERRDLLQHIRDRGIKDVAFVTGDIHTFFAGDVPLGTSADDAVALEFVGGSISSPGLGELGIDLGGGQTLPGNDADPNITPSVIGLLRQLNPWVSDADFDHHGYGVVEATRDKLDVRLRRLQTIKKRSRATLPDLRYEVARGQRSIRG